MEEWKRKVHLKCEPSTKIREMCASFILSDDNLKEIMQLFLVEVKKGLRKSTHEISNVKCYNTFIQHLPTGREEGEYLALVFQGERIRVLHARLGVDAFELQSNTYAISSTVKYNPSVVVLFDFLAQSVVDFCVAHKLNYEKIPLGFTFGFPTKQAALDAGILESWTKGFYYPHSIGKDVVHLLKEAFIRKKASGIEVLALVNDTTGTLMACAWKNPTCKIGLIVADGYNICYVENISHVQMFNGSRKKRNVIVNTECGAFGDNGELDTFRTQFDRDLNDQSQNRNVHLNEKMISGMYIGEIVRLVIKQAMDEHLLFVGQTASHRLNQYVFNLKHVSDICSDEVGVFTNCKKILVYLGFSKISEQDLSDVHYICERVFERSAWLVAAELATLIIKMGHNVVTIGIDGYVYLDSEVYRQMLANKVGELVGPNVKVDFVPTSDGSGKGAALVAAAVVEGGKRTKTVAVEV